MGLAVLTISLSTLLRKALEAKKAEKEYQSSIAEFISNVEVSSRPQTAVLRCSPAPHRPIKGLQKEHVCTGIASRNTFEPELHRKALEARKGEKEYQFSIAEFISNVEVTGPPCTKLRFSPASHRLLKRLPLEHV